MCCYGGAGEYETRAERTIRVKAEIVAYSRAMHMVSGRGDHLFTDFDQYTTPVSVRSNRWQGKTACKREIEKFEHPTDLMIEYKPGQPSDITGTDCGPDGVISETKGGTE